MVFSRGNTSLEGAYRSVEEKVRASLIDNPKTPHEDFVAGDKQVKYRNQGALVNFRVPPECPQVKKDQIFKVGIFFSQESSPFISLFLARENTSGSRPTFVTSPFDSRRKNITILPSPLVWI